MTGAEAYIVRFSAWAPGIGSPAEWDEWARDKRSITPGAKGPELSFADPMFRRRLSRVSKMTVQVVHDLLPVEESAKIIFLSFRGEHTRQFQVNKTLIEEKSVSPAAFSLSVYNAPVALATIAFGLKGGYTALYPAKDSFFSGLKAAQAALFAGTAPELLFVYADEEAPPEFERFSGEAGDYPPPAALGLLLSREPRPLSMPLSSIETDEDKPLAFLKSLILREVVHASP